MGCAEAHAAAIDHPSLTHSTGQEVERPPMWVMRQGTPNHAALTEGFAIACRIADEK